MFTYMLVNYSRWPLVWKTWKYQGIWNVSRKCWGKYLVRGNCSKTVHY